LQVRLKEHIENLKEGLQEKLKLAQHTYEEGHHTKWDDVKSIQKERT
jgi:hypothetical protein